MTPDVPGLTAAATRDPDGTYARVTAGGGVARDPVDGSWYVTSYELVGRLLRDGTLSAYPGRSPVGALSVAAAAAADRMEDFFDRWPVFADPPGHTRLRAAAAPAFTPAAVAAWADRSRVLADGLLADVTLPADLLTGFCAPLAVAAGGGALGVRPAEAADLERWSAAVMSFLTCERVDEATALAADAALAALTAHVRDAVLPRAGAEPLAAALAGLPLPDAVALYAQLLTGGVEPVTQALAGGLAVLLDPADDRLAALAAGELAADLLVDEVLRLVAPFHFVPRTTTAATPAGPVTVPAGQRLVLVLAGATRDPAAYPDPAALCPARSVPVGGRTLPFGAGRHFCLGAPLARHVLAGGLAAVAAWEGRPAIRAVRAVRRESLGASVWAEVRVEG